jgi:hypothetical protein
MSRDQEEGRSAMSMLIGLPNDNNQISIINICFHLTIDFKGLTVFKFEFPCAEIEPKFETLRLFLFEVLVKP